VDLRFGCEQITCIITNDSSVPEAAQPARYALTGLCCFNVDDQFGPPPEWDLFDTPFLWKLQRTPLVARVNALVESDWVKSLTSEDLHWPEDWLKDADGRELDGAMAKTLLAAYGEAVKSASAIIYYSEPDPEYTSKFANQDATVAISLRMCSSQMADWNKFGLKFIGGPVPPCALEIEHINFAPDDAVSRHTGDPTWHRFIEGHTYGMGDRYTLRLASSWDDIAFED
jgi:hypothetical protein